MWDSLTGDIDDREIELAQIAYDYGESGLEDKAIAIANHLPNHRYDFYIFEPLCQLYLERSDHQRLVKMINARDRLFMQDWEQHWQQFQGGLWHDHNIHQIVQLCSEQKRHDYPLQILSELTSARAKVNLLSSLARIKFAEKREEEALIHLEQADQISHQISDPRLRQALRQLVDEVLSYWSIGSG